jgi:putative ABC transport system ATP-binding protein
MSLIETRDLWKTYVMGSEEIHALQGVSIQIERGEYVAIMGPSGSGKSTLMNLIGCLDTPTKGSYLLNSKEVASMNDDELARIRNEEIGFVFQTFNLLPREKIWQILQIRTKNCLHQIQKLKKKSARIAKTLPNISISLLK